MAKTTTIKEGPSVKVPIHRSAGVTCPCCENGFLLIRIYDDHIVVSHDDTVVEEKPDIATPVMPQCPACHSADTYSRHDPPRTTGERRCQNCGHTWEQE